MRGRKVQKDAGAKDARYSFQEFLGELPSENGSENASDIGSEASRSLTEILASMDTDSEDDSMQSLQDSESEKGDDPEDLIDGIFN